MTPAPSWTDLLAAREAQHLDELFELLRMPSVSTDPQLAPMSRPPPNGSATGSSGLGCRSSTSCQLPCTQS